jgi:hypothetical protein
LLSGQLFDNAGAILSGGKVYTYLAGTSTPQAAYADALGSQALTQPAVLDASGRLQIYLVADLAQKIVVKTSADVTLWTADNITLSSAPTSAQLLPTGCTITTAQTTLTAVNGAATIVAAGFHDAKKLILGVTLNVTQTFGAGGGLTGLSLGDPGTIDRWGNAIALSAGTQPGLRFGGLPVFSVATDLVLSAESGTFSSTGVAVATKTVLTLP